jgi:Na+/proline symporter
MTPLTILLIVLLYFALLIGVSYFTGRKADNQSFFLGNRQSPWFVVAFGMVGASLSGVTFISVPGWVQGSAFSYMQVVLGYVLGYAVIIKILLPLYYRLNLTSIYGYLEQRFGTFSYRTGSFFFLLSRTIGAAFRLYLVAIVLDYAIFEALEVPFWVTVLITLALIWVYTFKGGIKTIIWTDTLQTTFMLLAVGIAVYLIKDALIGSASLVEYIADSPMSKTFFFDDFKDSRFFWKQFFSGAFITVVMTGLDQDMMQKNLSCRSLKDAQKNMFWLSIILVVVNLVFLCLGVLLYDYAALAGIEEVKDRLFPAVALSGGLGNLLPVLFMVGLIAAAYSSADSALTALTTSFCVDFLGIEKREATKAKSLRIRVHLMFSLILLAVILIFKYSITDASVINELFTLAGYTYGPLLGLYAFGLFTKWQVHDKWVPAVAAVAPVLSYLFTLYAKSTWDYTFSFEHLMVNGLLTFVGLVLLKKTAKSSVEW